MRRFDKLMAMVLSVAMIFQIGAPTTLAAEVGSQKEPKTVSGWVEPEQTEYTLPVGADEAAVKELLTLPETLTAQVQYVTTEEVPVEKTTTPVEEMTEDTASSQQSEQDTPPADTEPQEGKKATDASLAPAVKPQEGKKATDASLAPAVKPVEKLIVEEIQVPVTWESDKVFSTDKADRFIYTAMLADNDSFLLAEGVEMPSVTVKVVEQAQIFDLSITEESTTLGAGIVQVGTAQIFVPNTVTAPTDVNQDTQVTNVADTSNEWNTGWYVVESDVTIADRIEVKGNVNLILADNAHLTASQGIHVTRDNVANNVLTIWASSQEGTGKLTATGSPFSAGIGGNKNENGGTITVNGGNVIATGGSGGEAGIGGGSNPEGDLALTYGEITIAGGTVTAHGTGNGAGIGSGSYYAGGTVEISGGIVNAQGAWNGAGIGGGDNSNSGTITITGGIVDATGDGSGAGIGGGSGGIGVCITITGGVVTAQGGEEAAAIGGGFMGAGGEIIISGGAVTAKAANGCNGIGSGLRNTEYLTTNTFTTNDKSNNGNATIVATSIEDQSSKGSWSGMISEDGGENTTVYGSKKLNADYTVDTGKTLTVQGTLTIPSGVTLTNNGTTNVTGDINGAGTICGSGTATVTANTADEVSIVGPATNPVYTGTAVDADQFKLQKTLLGQAFDVSGWTVSFTKADTTVPEGWPAGTDYKVVFTKDGTTDVKVEQTFTITPAEITGTLAQSNKLVYKNGEALTPTASGLTAVNDQPVTIQYSMDENGTYGKIPAFMENGTYTVYYKATADNHNPKEGSFTVTVNQSATEFTGGIKAYKGTEETTTFTYGDTITVKVKPTATGIAPAQAGVRMRSLFSTAPAANQMALFINDIQVSEAVNAGSDGYYVMNLTTTDPTVRAQLKPGQTTEVTAKYVGNKNMADTTGTISLTVNKAPQAAPAVVIDYATETLNTTDKMEWYDAGGNPQGNCSNQMSVSEFGWNGTEAKVIKLRLSETENYMPGEVQELTIPARPDAPAAPTATDENITDTSITLNTVKGAEYQKEDEGWSSNTEFAGLNANTGYTFKQRLKATETSFASAESTAAITTKSVSKYTVKHLQQNISDDGYTEVEAQELFGITNAQTAAAAKTYEGFTAQAITQETIAADGTTVVEVKYDRKTYSIIWQNGDTTLKTDTVRHGATPVYAGAVPTKEADARYTYTFKEWSSAITAATGDAVYTAEFDQTVNKYTVKFVNEGGAVLQTEELEYGATPVYKGENPAKAGTTEYSYIFKDWDKQITPVTGDVAYTATYTVTNRSYTITWQNEDGTAIDTTTVEYGTVPSHADPTKDSTAQYDYTFAGWTPELASVTGEATYKATFTPAVRSYQVRFVDWNDTVLKTETVEYGSAATAPADPTRTGYTFSGWDKAFDSIAGATTVKARYTINQYTLTFDSKGGSTVNPIEQDYNSGVTAPAEPARAGYTFGGWYEQEDLSGSAYVFGKMPAESKTLYAKWNLAAPVIQADPENGTAAYPNAVTLSVQIAEIPGLTYTYQWYKGEAEVGTGKSLTLDTTAASGEYTVTVTVTDNAETKTTLKSAAKTVAIDKAVITGTITQNGSLTYNGREQTAEITNTLAAKGGQRVTVKFGIAADSCNADAVPVFTGAGTHTVYYKATAPDHVEKTGSFNVEIQQKEITVIVKNQNITYAEQPNILTGMGQMTVTDQKWGEPVITFAEDGKTATAVVTYENDKDHPQNLDTKVTSRVKIPATKETMGITTYTVSVDFAGKTYTVSKDVQDIPKLKPAETFEKVETNQLTEVPESLKDTPYNTVEKIEKAMEEVVLKKNSEQNAGNEQKTIIYDAVLVITENGVTRPATREEVEARGGITVVLPYPAGTNRTDFVFTVAHMLTVDMAGMRAGDIETPEITLTDTGLKVTLKGLSPVMVGYSKKAAATEPAEPTVPETTVPAEPTKPNPPTGTDVPQTGDESHMMLWILLGLVSICGLAGTVLFKKKKNTVR